MLYGRLTFDAQKEEFAMDTVVVKTSFSTQFNLNQTGKRWVFVDGIVGTAPIYGGPTIGKTEVLINCDIDPADPQNYGIVLEPYQVKLTISETGAVTGFLGVYLNGESASLINKGEITGSGGGVQATKTGASIVNSESIVGSQYGVLFGGAESVLKNSGLIDGDVAIRSYSGFGIEISNAKAGAINADTIGIQLLVGVDGVSNISNAGSINVTGGIAISGSDGIERVTNTGTIRGDILLGENDDVIDNRGGKILGAVSAGDGDDTYFVSDAKMLILEDEFQGTDTVKSTATFSLALAIYADQEIENVWLLGNKNINAGGNDLDNAIKGNAANNRLTG